MLHSAAALGALSGVLHVRTDLIFELCLALCRVECAGGSVGFMWVQHMWGLEWKERVDKAAKRASKQDEVGVRVDLSV